MDERELSFGEDLCGCSFNPGGRQDVGHMKQAFADIVDVLFHLTHSGDSKQEYLAELAIEHAATAQMWAVKALTAAPEEE